MEANADQPADPSTESAATSPKPTNVVLMGHSYIRRLGFFMENTQEYSNLKLKKENYQVFIRAFGSLRTSDLAYSREFLDVEGVETEDGVCFLQTGGNDLTSTCVTANEVAWKIMTLANLLFMTKKFRRVVIGQLLRRDPKKVGSMYNNKVIETNKLLHNLCKSTDNNVIFWHHRGFWDPEMKYLASDGLHIHYSKQNNRYMTKYLQSVKFAVLHAHRLQPTNENLPAT